MTSTPHLAPALSTEALTALSEMQWLVELVESLRDTTQTLLGVRDERSPDLLAGLGERYSQLRDAVLATLSEDDARRVGKWTPDLREEHTGTVPALAAVYVAANDLARAISATTDSEAWLVGYLVRRSQLADVRSKLGALSEAVPDDAGDGEPEETASAHGQYM